MGNNKKRHIMTETTPIDAEDLELYIDNEFDLYRDLWTPITTDLTKKKDAGTYDRDEADEAFLYLIRAGVQKYQKEFPETRIYPAVMVETGKSMCDRFEVEHSLGNYEYLLPTASQKEFMEMCYKIGMKNHWCSGKAAIEDGDYVVEEDRLNRDSFKIFDSLDKLKEYFARGNWCLGSSFIYNDLCFMNQVDGGGEWLTIKRFGDEAIAFESMSMSLIIKDEKFEDTIRRLEAATKEQCRTLNY